MAAIAAHSRPQRSQHPQRLHRPPSPPNPPGLILILLFLDMVTAKCDSAARGYDGGYLLLTVYGVITFPSLCDLMLYWVGDNAYGGDSRVEFDVLMFVGWQVTRS